MRPPDPPSHDDAADAAWAQLVSSSGQLDFDEMVAELAREFALSTGQPLPNDPPPVVRPERPPAAPTKAG